MRSSNNAVTNSPFRYNLNTGTAFNISCFTYATDAFTVSFYKDGVVISDGDLEDTTLTEIVLPLSTQKGIQLEFLNFQPVHDGVYHCFANTSCNTDKELSSDLYLYGSGEDCTCA